MRHDDFDVDELLRYSQDEWLIDRKGFSRNRMHMQVQESLFCVGNGYLNIRGSLEELPQGSMPGMYMNGIYDRSEADVEELVKCPVWTDVSFWIDGLKVSPCSCKVMRHTCTLDMRKGILHRYSRLKTPEGKILSITTARMVFMHSVHRGYMRVRVTAENFSGAVKVMSGLNGEMLNRGFFPGEHLKHLHLERIERGRDLMYLEMKTREQQIGISVAAAWRPVGDRKGVSGFAPRIYGEKFTSELTLQADQGRLYAFEKYAVVLTSREADPDRLFRESICELRAFLKKGATSEIGEHIRAWAGRWEQADIVIEGDSPARQALRYNIYQLLINAPPFTGSTGARFLSSEGYLGHIFWDTEIFIFPFYLYNFPKVARNMLMYRYVTLPGALKNAERAGYSGAKYGWESAVTGEDVTPRFASKLERTIRLIYTGREEDHIVSDVIYALERYFRVTGDEHFLFDQGLEMIFQTARFWVSRVDAGEDGYDIRVVIGPDEFHEHVTNNAYTNFLVRWHLNLAAVLYRYFAHRNLPGFERICREISLQPDEVSSWKDISRGLKFKVDEATGLIEQFDGYFMLRELTVTKHDRHGSPLLPPGVTYRTVDRTQLIKQADVLMIFILFPHLFSDDVKLSNYEYYERRTMHKSSLSHCSHAMVGLSVGKRQHAYNYFMKTARFDLENLHGNTHLGIHAAAVGGTWQTVVTGFGGLTLKSDRIELRPWLPKRWTQLSFRVVWRGRIIELAITHKHTDIMVRSDVDGMVACSFWGSCFRFPVNQVYRFSSSPVTCMLKGECDGEVENSTDSASD